MRRVTHPLRFATQLGGAASGAEWRDRARRLESLGYGTLAVPDHVASDSWAPLIALAAAAAATTTLRVGTLVLDNDFRNPLLLAREAAALDVVSEGRFELGLGAGWLDRDYESLGIPFDRGRVRVERLAEAVPLLKRLFTEAEVTHEGRYYRMARAQCRPQTVQRPHPPLLIAGAGPQILALAGREADIVAVVPHGAGVRKPRPQDVSFDTVREQLRWVREAARERFARLELSVFQDVILTDDRERAIADLAERLGVDPGVYRVSLYRVIGDLASVRAHVLRVREELGITYFCFRGPHVEELAPIVRELTGS